MTPGEQSVNSRLASTLTCKSTIYNRLYVNRGLFVGPFLNNPGSLEVDTWGVVAGERNGAANAGIFEDHMRFSSVSHFRSR